MVSNIQRRLRRELSGSFDKLLGLNSQYRAAECGEDDHPIADIIHGADAGSLRDGQSPVLSGSIRGEPIRRVLVGLHRPG